MRQGTQVWCDLRKGRVTGRGGDSDKEGST